jgi:hypothetical protein
MDNIFYPRSLNRPTYLFWRFTHQDIALIFGIFFLTISPSVFIDSYPVLPMMGLVAAYAVYRGAVVTLKPRGWEGHVLKNFFQAKQLNPGHCYRQCFIREKIPGGK